MAADDDHDGHVTGPFEFRELKVPNFDPNCTAEPHQSINDASLRVFYERLFALLDGNNCIITFHLLLRYLLMPNNLQKNFKANCKYLTFFTT